MKRLFFAIPIAENRKQLLLQLLPQKNFQGVRWVNKENLHITIHFLGATAEEKMHEVMQQAKLICETFPSFTLTFESLQVVMKNRKPVMVWAQFSESNSFNRFTISFRECFPTEEQRKPLPHLTLARIRQLRHLPFDLADVKPFSVAVHAIELWESHLNSAGATYSRIERWNLAESASTDG